ncbi:hypothetical protein C4K09_0155 [Pseudomonas chlororaphis subsp. aureofaciens]|nr:hypothetical protein C4K09_0155 [Pseudomonas chlororaphis subsp. aureofaciens]
MASFWRCLLPVWLLLTGSAQAAVDARDHQAFWLWSGVAPQPVLNQAKTLYILQGQISRSRRDPSGNVHFIAQGMAIPRLRQGEVWVVYRAHTLHWPEPVYRQLLGQVQRWQQAGNPVVGIQIDFDARTRYLDEYTSFLRDLRQRLPAQYRLSITGLMDWSSNANPRPSPASRASSTKWWCRPTRAATAFPTTPPTCPASTAWACHSRWA